jgi:tight adherence protein C
VLVILLAVLFLAGAAYLFAQAATADARDRQVSVKRAATYGKFRAARGQREQPFRERVVEPAKLRLASLVLRIHPKATPDGVRNRLLAAGLGRTVSPTGFLAAKAAAGIGGLLLGMIFSAVAGGIGLLLGVGLGALGFLAPDFVVGGQARKRRELIRAQLPDALDLLAVSVEAGLGFDGALSKLTDHMDGPLTEEFGLTLNEIRIGESRQDARKKLSERCDTPEVSGFTAQSSRPTSSGSPSAESCGCRQRTRACADRPRRRRRR